MDILEIINKKRLGKTLSKSEIEFAVMGYVNGTIPDYQMSSLLMAILLKGMTEAETITLTNVMLKSGERLDLSDLKNVVDKHSTGGVGDKTTLIVAPLAASCGVRVAKMSGRALGHTGGTIDKLESIPGFNIKLTNEKFFEQVNDIGIALVGQTKNLVPADKKIYALRDVTGTVESLPLIASSIMSKKIASGSPNLVVDIKVGNGALIKNRDDAVKLADIMIKIGKAHHMKVVCLITNMDIPLGNNIGNALEVEEAIDVLKNGKKGMLTDLCIALATNMVSLGLSIDEKKARELVVSKLNDGSAYNKFLEFVHRQGGDIKNLPKCKHKFDIRCNKSGYLTKLDALELGKFSMHLGAGRISLDDDVDYGAGIVIHKNINDKVKKGEVIMTIHTNRDLYIKDMQRDLYTVTDDVKKNVKLIYKVIKGD